MNNLLKSRLASKRLAQAILISNLIKSRPLIRQSYAFYNGTNYDYDNYGSSSVSSTSWGAPTERASLPRNTIIKFVPQQEAWIVERMGKFHRILEPGLNILAPIIDRIKYPKGNSNRGS
ncbi:Putative Cell division cycle 20-like protein 1, cofactor-APC complex [Rhizopus microsporus]|nr:Putative Cell division cycle 20-like protein 1, cofactor-APC complex [Rhizopus microsporus]